MATATGFTFDSVRHLYLDENDYPVPSTTQALKAAGLISFDHINPRILEHKRQIGTLVHQVTEMFDRGEDLSDYDIPIEIKPYLDGYANFRLDCHFEPDLIEHRQLAECRGMRWGMTTDRTGLICGAQHVIELKCGAAHPAHGVQLASYDLGLNGKQRFSRVSVQLSPDFPRGYKVHAWEDPADYSVWLSALVCTIWKQNHGTTLEDVPERLVG